MGSEETERIEEQPETGGSGRRRRRRRRRNRRHQGRDGGEGSGRNGTNRNARGWRGRDAGGPSVHLPSSGRVPYQYKAIHPHRGSVSSATARRRRMNRAEMDELSSYLGELPESLTSALYRGMGGQPDRVTGTDRMIQLTIRAIAQGNRLANLVKALPQRNRQALAILIQCGGMAHHEEFLQELILSLGGTDREWARVLTSLGDKGLLAATDDRDGQFFYLVPEPLMGHLIDQLSEDLALPSFDHEDVRVIDAVPFQPPLDFSVVTLTTYIDQHPPRLTQRHEIFKVHKDEMDEFFAQLWATDSDLFSFHIEFLMMHGVVELRGDRLAVNRSVVEEWLNLDPEDQRDLFFKALDKGFPQAEWMLWAIHHVGGDWVPERPLQALYRRWRRGEEWRERFHKDQWASTKTALREGYSFTALVNGGMLEMGQWGQEKFYRLTPRAQRLLEPTTDEGFTQFYLTPNFEIMAPAGMSPLLFFRIGELAELVSCDRANTYRITEVTIERAMEKGWRRDDILEFLQQNSQIGLPENVDQTLRGWMGHHGDVEFHDVLLLTIHRSQVRRVEGDRRIKPFLLHRFVPGMYAVDRARVDEFNAILAESGISPSQQIRKYPDDPQQIEARKRLLDLVHDARHDREDMVAREQAADTHPANLHPIPGSSPGKKRRRKKGDNLPPRCSTGEIRDLCEQAMSTNKNLQMLYVTRNQERQLICVAPERLALNHLGQQVLVARDVDKDQRLSYQVMQIERMKTIERR